MDGSSSQPVYSYKEYSSTKWDNRSEMSLFSTVIVPLRIVDEFLNVIWASPSPQSDRFCRPIRLQFRKETKELVIEEHQRMCEQISLLQSFIYEHKGRLISVKFNMIEAMLDGKCLNFVLGNESTQRCPVCFETSSNFHDSANTFHLS